MMCDPEVIIRNMREEDLDRVSQIEKENFSSPWSRKAFEDMLERDDALYLVAEIDGYVVANCGLIDAAGEGDICNVAVDKEYRNKGIGSRLICEIMSRASSELGTESFTLEVRAGNRAAISVYEKLGFVSEGIRPGFYTSPAEDAVIYWKR